MIAEIARPDALAHVATHVGKSRTRNLTPEQRRELMVRGRAQDGIGLEACRAFGAAHEMRSHPEWDPGKPVGSRPHLVRAAGVIAMIHDECLESAG